MNSSRQNALRKTGSPKAEPTTVELYRPVSRQELDLIARLDYQAFPPRLPDQPIFYPVLTRKYADQIARNWNARDPASNFRGYVLRFRVRAEYLSHFEVHTVGGTVHQEYWIPGEKLEAFNRNLVGKIEVVAVYDSRCDIDVKRS
jgi:hypothetical protein